MDNKFVVDNSYTTRLERDKLCHSHHIAVIEVVTVKCLMKIERW